MIIHYSIKYNNIHQSELIDRYIENHLSELNSVISNKDTFVQAQIELEKSTCDQNNHEIYRAEINLHTTTDNFFITETDVDIFAAINKMCEITVQNVRSRSEKLHNNLLKREEEIKDIL